MKLFKFVLLIPALAATTALASGNGGGYSGPSFSVPAVPSSPDSGILGRDLKKAISVCLVEGDSSRGIIPALAPLFQAQFGSSLKNIRGTTERLVGIATFNKGEKPSGFYYSSGLVDTYEENRIDVLSAMMWDDSVISETSRDVLKKYSHLANDVMEDAVTPIGQEIPVWRFHAMGGRPTLNETTVKHWGKTVRKLNFGKILGLPQVTYESSVGGPYRWNLDATPENPEVYFDEYEFTEYFGVKIEAESVEPGEIFQRNGIYSLYTGSKGLFKKRAIYKDTSVRVDVFSYAECLQSEIQKAAR
jgi:hypothetical protein